MDNQIAVFFDLDKSIVACSTEKDFGFYLFRKGILNFKTFRNIIINYIGYDIHISKNFMNMKSKVVYDIVKDVEVGFYEIIFKEYFHEVLKHKIYPQILTLMKQYKKQGFKIYIVSAALAIVVKPFADYLGADGYFSTELEVENGKYNGKVKGVIHYGENKAKRILEVAALNNIDLAKSYAYGDYIEDYHMLKLVGNPVAINPDKKLRKLAMVNQWDIQRWIIENPTENLA